MTLDHQIWHDFNGGGLSAPYYGNVVGETWSSSDLAFVTRSRELHYVNNSSAWILGLPRDVIDEQTTSPSSSGPVIRRTMTFYDGSLSSTATPTRGDVTRVDRLRDGAVMTTNIKVDAYGRAEEVTAPGSRLTKYTYAMAGYVATVTNPLGHVTTTLTDTGFGLPLLVEVRASSAGPVTSSTSYRYDAGGRLVGVTQPGDSFETVEFGYGFTSNGQPQAWSRSSVYMDGPVSAKRWLHTWSFSDGLGRPSTTQSFSRPDLSTSHRNVTATRYDAAGNVAATSDVFETAGDPAVYSPVSNWSTLENRHEYLYDPLGRVMSDTTWGPGGVPSITSTSYDGRRTTVDPPVLDPVHSDVNAVGAVQRVIETGAGGSVTTIHTYDAGDRLVSTSNGTTTTTQTWNQFDQRTGASDPNLGTWAYTYSSAGDLASQTDARNKTVWFAYDQLGRKTSERIQAAATPRTAEWFWDPVGHPGLLSAHQRDVDGQWLVSSFGYDARGRPTSQTWNVPTNAAAAPLAGQYTVATTYDSAGHVTSRTWPSGGSTVTATATYDALGRAFSLAEPGRVYVDSTTYDAVSQRMTARTLGGAGGVQVLRTWSYEAGSRRLARAEATVGGSPAVDFTYSYDQVGNVTRVVDAANTGQRSCFVYDTKGRLDRAYTGNDACTAYDPARGVGPYDEDYVYDNLGRITSLTHQDGSSPVETRTYNYTSTPAQPHAADRVVRVVSGLPTPFLFSHDANGNQISRSTPLTGGAQTLVWDDSNRLKSISGSGGTSSYVYDAEGARIARRDPGGTTLYLGGDLEVTVVAGVRAHTRYPSLGGTAIAVATDSSSCNFLLGDHLGSTSATVNVTTGAVLTQRYYPYGGSRPTLTPGLPTERGFTGHTRDTATGLIHAQARQYDPWLAQFISADTVTPGSGVFAHNRYAYTNDNPVNLVDPSGHFSLPSGFVLPTGCNLSILSSCTSGGTGSGSGGRTSSSVGDTHGGSGCRRRCGYTTGILADDIRDRDRDSVSGLTEFFRHVRMMYANMPLLPTYSFAELASLGPGIGEAIDIIDCAGGAWISCAMLGVPFVGGRFLRGLNSSFHLGRYDGAPRALPAGPGAGGTLRVAGSGFSTSEQRVAQLLYEQGNDVVLRQATGVGRTSDLLLNGVRYDVYSPTTGSVDRIVSAIASKGSQVRGGGVVLDLSSSPLSAADLGNILPRVQGVTSQISDIIIVG